MLVERRFLRRDSPTMMRGHLATAKECNVHVGRTVQSAAERAHGIVATEYYTFVDALRGIPILMVILVHAQLYSPMLSARIASLLGSWASCVQLFRAISGSHCPPPRSSASPDNRILVAAFICAALFASFRFNGSPDYSRRLLPILRGDVLPPTSIDLSPARQHAGCGPVGSSSA